MQASLKNIFVWNIKEISYAILNAQATKDIKNGKISEVISNELNDTADRLSDTRKITAKVFFSFLDS